MQRTAPSTFFFLPEDEQEELRTFDPVLCCEETGRGWRGLTAMGEVFDVQAPDGEPRAIVPIGGEVIVVNGKGERIGRRVMPQEFSLSGKVDRYLRYFHDATHSYRQNDFGQAKRNIDIALMLVPTYRARFNRSLISLSMGQWEEGFADHEARLDLMMPPLCAEVEALGIPRWRGEDISGKTLLLVYDSGFGDAVQMLRYMPKLTAMNVNVKLYMPPELNRFLEQVAPVAVWAGDYYCPMLSLPHVLHETTLNGKNDPYLDPYESDLVRYRKQIGGEVSLSRRIGIAWSVGRTVVGDYPRAISLSLLVKALRKRHPGAELYSLQTQDDTLAVSLGVNVQMTRDFADVAALVSLMDEVVTVDTAAAHVAGAIGHPKITVLLPYWHSWRWREDQPLYRNVTLCRQDAPGDWDSALAKL